mgnify:CR=1 FL=1
MTTSADFSGPESHAHVFPKPTVRRGPLALVLLVLVLALTGLALAVKTWGLVALGLTALAMVPVIFAMLILITVGK